MVPLDQFMTVPGLAVLVLVFVQLAKGKLKPEWTPLFAVAVGIVFNVVLAWTNHALSVPADYLSVGLGGLFAGLMATGSYELVLDTIKLGGD